MVQGSLQSIAKDVVNGTQMISPILFTSNRTQMIPLVLSLDKNYSAILINSRQPYWLTLQGEITIKKNAG